MDYDVLVVGAGPAGSSAARAAAENGAKTLLVDRKRRIGHPEQCGGAIGAYLLPFLPFEVPKELLTWKIDELRFRYNGLIVKRRGGPWTSYAIKRGEFDSWLAANAINAGAKLLLESELVNIEMDGNGISEAEVNTPEGKIKIKPKVVIAADGTNSTVVEQMGIKNKNAVIGNAFSYEFANVKLDAPHADQLFFSEFSSGGYAYVFPLSKNSANVGIGSITERDLEKRFEEFCESPEMKKQLKGAAPVSEKSGRVPFGRMTERCQYGNVLLAGDAATQNIKPLVEGILPSLICGDIAGKTAAQYIKQGIPLSAYESNIKSKLGPVYTESNKYISAMEGLRNTEGDAKYLLTMGLCAGIFMPGEMDELKNKSAAELVKMLDNWNGSGIKRLKTSLAERAAILYLRLASKSRRMP